MGREGAEVVVVEGVVGEDVHKDPHIDWAGSFSLTPHMWDEQNEPRWGPKGPRRKGGGQDKERNGRKEGGGAVQEEAAASVSIRQCIQSQDVMAHYWE